MEVESSCDAAPSASAHPAEMSPSSPSSTANGALRLLLSRSSPFAESEFEPTPELQDLIGELKILVVGAGGLGCELLKVREGKEWIGSDVRGSQKESRVGVLGNCSDCELASGGRDRILRCWDSETST